MKKLLFIALSVLLLLSSALVFVRGKQESAADGHPLFGASMSYFPTMGGDAIRVAKDILQGGDFEKNIIQPTYVVTSENVDQYLDKAY